MTSTKNDVAADGATVDVEKVPVSGKHPSDAVLKYGNDADEAMKAFAGHEGEVIELDEATNKRLLRKIDWHLMPIMCLVYAMNFLDSEQSRLFEFPIDDDLILNKQRRQSPMLPSWA